MPFSDLLWRGGALGGPVADGIGDQRAGSFGAQPGGFGGQGGDALVGAGDVRACRAAAVWVRVTGVLPGWPARVAEGLGRVVVAGRSRVSCEVNGQSSGPDGPAPLS